MKQKARYLEILQYLLILEDMSCECAPFVYGIGSEGICQKKTRFPVTATVSTNKVEISSPWWRVVCSLLQVPPARHLEAGGDLEENLRVLNSTVESKLNTAVEIIDETSEACWENMTITITSFIDFTYEDPSLILWNDHYFFEEVSTQKAFHVKKLRV